MVYVCVYVKCTRCIFKFFVFYFLFLSTLEVVLVKIFHLTGISLNFIFLSKAMQSTQNHFSTACVAAEVFSYLVNSKKEFHLQ